MPPAGPRSISHPATRLAGRARHEPEPEDPADRRRRDAGRRLLLGRDRRRGPPPAGDLSEVAEPVPRRLGRPLPLRPAEAVRRDQRRGPRRVQGAPPVEGRPGPGEGRRDVAQVRGRRVRPGRQAGRPGQRGPGRRPPDDRLQGHGRRPPTDGSPPGPPGSTAGHRRRVPDRVRGRADRPAPARPGQAGRRPGRRRRSRYPERNAGRGARARRPGDRDRSPGNGSRAARPTAQRRNELRRPS
jgi:hypothetical protein